MHGTAGRDVILLCLRPPCLLMMLYIALGNPAPRPFTARARVLLFLFLFFFFSFSLADTGSLVEE